MKYHLKMDVKGALRNWDDRMMDRVITHKGLALPAQEGRARLMIEQARGTKYLPCGDCDHWDPECGCLGHEEATA